MFYLENVSTCHIVAEKESGVLLFPPVRRLCISPEATWGYVLIRFWDVNAGGQFYIFNLPLKPHPLQLQGMQNPSVTSDMSDKSLKCLTKACG